MRATAAADSAAAVECRQCGAPIPTRARPGNTIRCSSCGKAQRYQPAARPVPLTRTGGGTWNPPSEPREFADVGGTCSDCHAPVQAEPRGTAMWCTGCRSAVTPPGVEAPYQRGTEVTRAARSQRERDLEALDLAGRKGVMIGQLAALTADDRLDDASKLKAEWFAEQVKTAPNTARLDELAALFTEAGIRRRRWWHERPALTAGYDDGQADEDDQDGYDVEDQDDGGGRTAVTFAATAAITARARAMTWAEAVTACGWTLSTGTDGCQIVDSGLGCTMAGARQLGRIRACGYHQASLNRTIRHYQDKDKDGDT